MRRVLVLAAVLLSLAAPAMAADLLAEARRYYNLGDYDAAADAARAGLEDPRLRTARAWCSDGFSSSGTAGRAALSDLADARAALRAVDPALARRRERLELSLGLAETLCSRRPVRRLRRAVRAADRFVVAIR
jgi:hypothetical protein